MTQVDLNAPILFFPVRHHSPACARLVQELIERVKPTAVLIEGPSNYNPYIDELRLPHRLPIAIYSYVRQADGSHLSAYHPFCDYSPEWVAIQTAHTIGAEVRFIDLPWVQMATLNTASHRYADGELAHNPYIESLFATFGVENFHDLWDTFFEVDDTLTLETYLEQATLLMRHIRQEMHQLSPDTEPRESFMAQQIQQARQTLTGQLIVVTGGFHTPALSDQFIPSAHPIVTTIAPTPNTIEEEGIALTPYSYERLDNLTGYNAGMPNPGFYHHVWHNNSEEATHHILLRQVAQRLRQQKQMVSTADLIAVETTAQSLAHLRGHRRIWRQDLVDGIIGALVKEELAYGFHHAFLDALYEVLRGKARGRLAAGTRLPPLVEDIQRQLEATNLVPEPSIKQISLDLQEPEDRAKSQLLHRLLMLELPGIYLRSGVSAFASNDVWEQWQLVWQVGFEGACIEQAVYGSTLITAVTNKLYEALQQLKTANSARAAALLLQAAHMGLPLETIAPQLKQLIQQDQDFFTVTGSLQQLLFLYRFDDILGITGSIEIGALLKQAFQRSLWLLQNLGVVQDRDEALLTAVQSILTTYERGADILDTPLEDLSLIFKEIVDDETQTVVVRGASNGVLWMVGQASTTDLLSTLRLCAEPEELGDFLTGLFFIARETAQRQPDLITSLDSLLAQYDEEAFLTALPALRLAFSFFTPREKHYMAQHLFEEPITFNLEISTELLTAVHAFENKLYQTMKKYNL